VESRETMLTKLIVPYATICPATNSREYLSHSFKQFMASHGIPHQTSCAYTPQQNDVAERKNRHLIETTRTLLIYGEVPEHFSGDAILTTCYLINHMLSTVLKNNIPHSILFPHEPLHLLPLRVFRFTCFVHNFSPGLDKLSPRSLKCVFLGFTRSQKGYKCFSPFLSRYFVSADVTFDEFSLCFKSQSSPLTPSNPDNSPSTFIVPIVCDPLTMSSSPSVLAPQSASPPPPLQVYSRRNRSQPLPCDSTQVPTILSPPALTPESDLPIALQKVCVLLVIPLPIILLWVIIDCHYLFIHVFPLFLLWPFQKLSVKL